MSEQNKQLSEMLRAAMEELPDDVRADLQKGWTAEAIGAKKVCDMTENRQPG